MTTTATQPPSTQIPYQTTIFSLLDSPAKPSPSPESASDLTKPEEPSSSISPESSGQSDHDTSSWKTSKAYSAMTEGELSESSSTRLQNWGIAWNGKFSTAKITASLSPENASTLSDILEEFPPERFYLSPDRVTRILQSASQQKPQLLEHIRQAEIQAATTQA